MVALIINRDGVFPAQRSQDRRGFLRAFNQVERLVKEKEARTLVALE